MSASPEISIVVPAYEEAPRMARTVAQLAGACALVAQTWEIVVAVEPSADATLQAALEAAGSAGNIYVLDLKKHLGKGHAVREGVLQAGGDIIFFCDADLSADLAALGEFIALFRADPDLDGVIGVRRKRIGRAPFLRRWLSGCFHAAVQRLTRLPFADTQCGFKAFRRQRAHFLANAQRQTGYAFDIEWLLLAQREGWNVAQCPIVWTDQPQSHIWLPRDGLDLLLAAWRLGRRSRKD